QVETAGTAEEAVEIVRRRAPAVALIDVHMPGHGGLWLCEQIRALSRDTAMILATSDAQVPPTTSMKRGVTSYVVKPIDAAILLKAVAAGFQWWATEGQHQMPPAVSAAMAAARAQEETRRAQAAERGGAAGARGGRRGWMPLVWVAAAALLVAAAGAGWWYFIRNGQSAVVGRLSAAAATVRAFGPSGAEISQGSGFFVGPDVFVTAHHVVRGATRVSLQGAGGSSAVAGVLGVDSEHDLAVLKTVPAAASYLQLADGEPAVGDAVLVFGTPLGLQGTLSTGIVSSIALTVPMRLQITAAISPGSSGSPVANDAGDVVGVAVSSREAGQALNFAVPARFVQAMVRRAGPVAPLVAAARGAFDDREREELVGPVRSVVHES
ncbi:MAG: trypsin-like peptidase domain-containing protein, partial [Vicinamibacterales bacterium]